MVFILEVDQQEHYLANAYEDNYSPTSTPLPETEGVNIITKFAYSYALRHKQRSADPHEVRVCLQMTTNKETMIAYPVQLVLPPLMATNKLIELFFQILEKQQVRNPRTQGYITIADFMRPGFCRIFMILPNGKRLDILKFKDNWNVRIPDTEEPNITMMQVDIILEQNSGIKIRSD